MAEKELIITYGDNGTELFLRRPVLKPLSRRCALIVPPTASAIVIKDGVMLETLEGGRYALYQMTGASKRGSLEVVFISSTASLRMMWGTPSHLDLRDPATGVAVKAGAYGELEVTVSQPRKFYLKIVGDDRTYTVDKLSERITGRLMSEFKPILAKIMRERGLSYDRADEFGAEIAANARPALNAVLEREYGVRAVSFSIAKIFITEESRREIERELKRLRKSYGEAAEPQARTEQEGEAFERGQRTYSSPQAQAEQESAVQPQTYLDGEQASEAQPQTRAQERQPSAKKRREADGV